MSDQSSSHCIEFKNVSKSYGDIPVLTNFSMAVERGEHIALIGPSGSGKTTVLRILMTLEKIQSGSVWIEGESLCHMPYNGSFVEASEAHLRYMRKRIGMVFQHFNLFPHITAFDNVALPPQIALRVPKEEASERATELLRMVGLSHKADHYPAQLSGGQKQRIAIARALAMRPEIMLFDEVTSALDPELVGEVLSVLRDIGKETNKTMILVTHEMSFASEFSNRVIFMDGGKIVEQGNPKQIFTEPKEERTREFLRKMLAAGQRLS